MTDELESVRSEIEGRIIQIVSKSGNAAKAFMPRGMEVYANLVTDLGDYLSSGTPQIFSAVGQDERGNNVPFTVVLADISFVMLFPPPSGLATPSNISVLDPSRLRH